MTTRSMLQVMLELAATVRVPTSDIDAGRAADGLAVPAPGEAPEAAAIAISSGDTKPGDAFVAVQYGGRWFWIPTPTSAPSTPSAS
jgi:hypothetical protein